MKTMQDINKHATQDTIIFKSKDLYLLIRD